MKRIILSIALTMLSFYVNAQIRTNSGVNQNTVTSSSAFIDASSSTGWNGTNNVGKGLVFPKTDLTTLATLVASPSGIPNSFPNRLDGMIVYNVGTGAPKINPTATPNVTPGFYYYENKTSNLQGGRWVRIGDGSANAGLALVENTVVETADSIDGKSIFAIKGSFNNTLGNNITITKPDGFAKLHSIKMYKKTATGGTSLVGTDLYSYELVDNNTKLKLVFGSGIMSIAYPEGEYEYVLEFLKS